MIRYMIILILLPLIYVGSYGYYCWKNDEKLSAVGVYIAAVIPIILAAMMIIINT